MEEYKNFIIEKNQFYNPKYPSNKYIFYKKGEEDFIKTAESLGEAKFIINGILLDEIEDYGKEI
jgi:hypothetical protein